MGQEIESIVYDLEAEQMFMDRLYQETKILKQYIEDRVLEDVQEARIGMEIEAWILDSEMNVSPMNMELLDRIGSSLLVPELSKFNFEMNTPPFILKGKVFREVDQMISLLWKQCQKTASEMDLETLLIGIAPTANDKVMSYENISTSNRYIALNDRLLMLREHPAELNISSDDVCLRLTLQNLTFAAICTSLQIHLQVGIDQIGSAYNAAQIAAAPVLAISGNSPFVNELDLWDESRIAVFEQSVALPAFRCEDGWEVGQASFGSGYIHSSIMELFLENFTHFPVILPEIMEGMPEELRHLKMHNGTIWRWNRPVVGISENNIPHIRIELRPLPSGPTIPDMIANMVFYLGLTLYYSFEENILNNYISYSDIRSNFYQAAQRGLNARFGWTDCQTIIVGDLIREKLLAQAKSALVRVGIDQEDIVYYLDEVIGNRIREGQTGAVWQRKFIHKYGRDFHAMSRAYLECQMSGTPVYRWKV